MTDEKSTKKPKDNKGHEADLEDLPAERAKGDDAQVKGGIPAVQKVREAAG
jgi:hypothetical protein